MSSNNSQTEINILLMIAFIVTKKQIIPMKIISKIFVLLGFTILISSCNVGTIVDRIINSGNNDDANLLIKKSFPISTIKAANVTTSGGSISVMGDADQEAVIEMYVKSNRGRSLSKSEIQEILDQDYEINIEQRNGVLHAHAKSRGNLSWMNALSISFKIRTGNNLTTDLSTSGGSIQLANLSGKQSFKTSGGSLELENIIGNIDGKTSGGSIKAYNAQGIINLRTSGGTISLEDLEGEVAVSTSGGSINGNSIEGSLSAKTSGGSINLKDLVCEVNASTSGGSVTVGIIELVGEVQLSTSGGSVNLTLPINASANLNLKGSKVNASSLSNFNGTNSKGVLRGTINGGRTQVKASTSAGSVNLTFK